MTLLPYMIAFIAGAIGWTTGNKLGGLFAGSMGLFLGSLFSLVLSILGFHYGRKYVKNLKEMMGP